VHAALAEQLAGQLPADPYAADALGARVEMSPDAGHLLVIPTWRRALSHLAPHRRAGG
jgi:hypothetical protein